MKIDFDVDIDMADRDQFLNLVSVTPASIKDESGKFSKHNTGVYFQNISKFPLEGISDIDYRDAEEAGWFKVDVLNNSVYNDITSESHLNTLLGTEPLWDLLLHPDFSEQLFHVGNYSNILQMYKPTTVEQLAMILAIIRPGKKHLIGKSFKEIENTVWQKPLDGSYYFKKSHAVAYALTIIVQMNLICEKISYGYS